MLTAPLKANPVPKIPHVQLLIQTCQFYMGSSHKLLKSKHCYFFNTNLPWRRIWGWWCSRYLHNHGFLLCEKFQCLKFRYTEVIDERFSWAFLKCLIVSDIYVHVHLHLLIVCLYRISNIGRSFSVHGDIVGFYMCVRIVSNFSSSNIVYA